MTALQNLKEITKNHTKREFGAWMENLKPQTTKDTTQLDEAYNKFLVDASESAKNGYGCVNVFKLLTEDFDIKSNVGFGFNDLKNQVKKDLYTKLIGEGFIVDVKPVGNFSPTNINLDVVVTWDPTAIKPMSTQNGVPVATDIPNKYINGFNFAMSEVAELKALNKELRVKIIHHFLDTVADINQDVKNFLLEFREDLVEIKKTNKPNTK